MQRKPLGTALAHLRDAGWPIEREWLSQIDPATATMIRIDGARVRVLSAPKKVVRAKVYRMTNKAIDRIRSIVKRKGEDAVGFARWQALKRLGLAEAG